MATGRSDYPNQVNNVLGFPYIFRGALDVRATTINDAMKIAAAKALAELAREDVPDEVAAAYQGNRPRFGPQLHHPGAVRPAPDLGHPGRRRQGRDGVAASPASRSSTSTPTRSELSARRDPIASTLQRIYERVRRQPKRVVFAEGEEEQVMRAAVSYANQKLGTAILVGREEVITRERRATPASTSTGRASRSSMPACRSRNARLCRLSLRAAAAQGLPVPRLPAADQQRPQPFRRLHGGARRCRRDGHRRDAQLFDRAGRRPPRHRRQARPPRHRRLDRALRAAAPCSSPTPPSTTCRTPSELADIAEEAAGFARRLGYEPRVAMLAYSTFGHPRRRALRARAGGGEDPRQAPRRFRV